MMLSRLIEDLTEAMENGGDREVLVASQPSWPLANVALRVYDPAADAEPQDDDGAPMDDGDASVVWIATEQVGSERRSPYAPQAAWDGVSW